MAIDQRYSAPPRSDGGVAAATFPPMNITGWFQVGWSKDFEPGTAAPLRFFGTDMVAFRTEAGELHVLDAHCAHLGAHLGHGGSVNGNCVVCPFHAWEWNGDGENTLIPYQDRPNKARKIRTWHSLERNEAVFVWHDGAGRDPMWEPPDMFRDLTPIDEPDTVEEFYPANPDAIVRYDNIAVHPQLLIENSVDIAHFWYVHGSNPPPTVASQELGEHTFRTAVDFVFGGGHESTWLTPDGPVPVRLHNYFNGLGLSYAAFEGGDRYRTMLSATPVDDQHSTLFHSIWVPRLPGDDGDRIPEKLQRRLGDAKWQLTRDIDVWVHQRYIDPAGLAASEVQGFNMVRRWAKRFYAGTPENAELGAATD